MTMRKTLITSRDPKGLQFIDLCEAAYNKAALDENQAQRLNENGGELQAGLKKLIAELSVSDRFASEEVESSYGYLSGYKPKGITKQVNRLRELFPDIGYANEKLTEQPLPTNAEGWFAIPRWEKVADTYGEAVQKVLDLIKQTRDGKFYNYREGQLGPQYLRQSAKKVQAFQTLGSQRKKHDILVVPAQFGLRHRDCSVRRALEIMNASEFGLGTFAVGIMLLTHPERLQHYDDPWIDCAGDKFAPDGGDFSHAPYFHFNGGKVKFRAGWSDDAYEYCGSASAFLPHES